MLLRRLCVLLRLGGVLLTLLVIATAVLLRSAAMGLRCILVMFGSLVVFVLGHLNPPMDSWPASRCRKRGGKWTGSLEYFRRMMEPNAIVATRVVNATQ